jgi:non-heme chloroperoxidase
MTLTPRERDEIDRAGASGRPTIVLVHGLWLLASSWDRWRSAYEGAGYATVAPAWPDDPETVAAARQDPDVFARKMVGQVTEHHHEVVDALPSRPALVGHSFGGLIVQKLAGEGASAATVAIDPAPFRGVLPVPVSSLRSSAAVVGNPANLHRAVTLTFEQYRYGWANALDEDEARALYDEFHVAASGAPIFQAVAANLNPFSETRVDTAADDRGPLLVVSGEKDHTIPHAVAHAAYVRQRRNAAPTEFVELAGRGHSLTIDHGWREVADTALAFVRRYVPAGQPAAPGSDGL